MSERIGGNQPRLERRKRIPNIIRMYAPIAVLDLIMVPPHCCEPKPFLVKRNINVAATNDFSIPVAADFSLRTGR